MKSRIHASLLALVRQPFLQIRAGFDPALERTQPAFSPGMVQQFRPHIVGQPRKRAICRLPLF